MHLWLYYWPENLKKLETILKKNLSIINFIVKLISRCILTITINILKFFQHKMRYSLNMFLLNIPSTQYRLTLLK